MTEAQIIDQIIRKVSAGINTDDSRLNRRALEDQLPPWRVEAIKIVYNGSKTRGANKLLAPELFQEETIVIDQSIQVAGADFILFQGAAPASIGSRLNGFVFVGNQKQGVPFTQLKGVNAYNIVKDAGLLEPGKTYFEAYQNFMKVWNNKLLKSIYKNFIAADPRQVSGFNEETDEYPVSQDVFEVIQQLAYADLVPEMARPADKVNDGMDTLDRRALKANIV